MEHIVQAVSIRWYNACAYYAVALARGLDMLGRRVTVIGGRGSRALEHAEKTGLDVLGSPGLSSPNPLSFAAAVRLYRSYALGNGVTLVNAHHGSDHAAWALALRGTGIPIVRTSGNQLPPNVNPASRLLIQGTSGIIASCGTVRAYYRDAFGLDERSMPVINGGVDCSHYMPGFHGRDIRDEHGIPDDAFVFGIVGRFSPVKGHGYFFEAAKLCARNVPDTWFLVSGNRAQLDISDIRRMADDNGVSDRTVFVPRLKDVRHVISALDAGVIASTGSETVCRIAMEYAAMGIPVAASDTNVVPEIVRDGLTGLVFGAGDAEALAGAMTRLAGDRDAARAMGGRARQLMVDEYSLERFASRTLDEYGGMTGHG